MPGISQLLKIINVTLVIEIGEDTLIACEKVGVYKTNQLVGEIRHSHELRKSTCCFLKKRYCTEMNESTTLRTQ